MKTFDRSSGAEGRMLNLEAFLLPTIPEEVRFFLDDLNSISSWVLSSCCTAMQHIVRFA